MSTVEALTQLRGLRQPIFRTGDAAARLRVRESTAHDTLKRLEAAGLVVLLRHGLWSTDLAPDPMAIADRVVAPYPAYVSFESALFRHGMIQQIPPRVTLASLDRARTIKTAVGTYVVRHVPPHLFGGYEDRGKVRLATPEKTLFDAAYHAAQRGWRSAYFPEIEIPEAFDLAALNAWIARITSAKLRTMTEIVAADLGVPGYEQGRVTRRRIAARAASSRSRSQQQPAESPEGAPRVRARLASSESDAESPAPVEPPSAD